MDFIKNYDKLVEFAQKKNLELESVNRVYKTGFYGMTINVDYNLLIERLKVSRTIVDIM